MPFQKMVSLFRSFNLVPPTFSYFLLHHASTLPLHQLISDHAFQSLNLQKKSFFYSFGFPDDPGKISRYQDVIFVVVCRRCCCCCCRCYFCGFNGIKTALYSIIRFFILFPHQAAPIKSSSRASGIL